MIHRKAVRFLCLTGLAAFMLGGCWQDDAKTNDDLPTYFYISQYSGNSAGAVAADTLTMHAGSPDGAVVGIAVHVTGPNDSTLRYDVLWNGTSWNADTLCLSIPESYIPQALWEQGSFSEMDFHRCFSVDNFINRAQKIGAATYENVFSAAMLDLREKSFLDSSQIRAMGLVGACPATRQTGRYAEGVWVTEQGKVIAMGVSYQGELGAIDEELRGGCMYSLGILMDSVSGQLYGNAVHHFKPRSFYDLGRADDKERCASGAALGKPDGPPTWFEFSHPNKLFADESLLNSKRDRFLLDSTEIIRAYYDTSSQYLQVRFSSNWLMLSAANLPKAGDSLKVLNSYLWDGHCDIAGSRPVPDYAVVDSLVDGVLYGRTGYFANHAYFPNEYWSFAMRFDVKQFEVKSCEMRGTNEISVCPLP